MTKFIAEVSSNHYRDIERCFSFIQAAARAGCGAVKFQLFRVDKLFAAEILESSEDHRKRRGWELPLEFLPMLAKCAEENNIEFSCTPFYLEAVELLEPYVDFYKIASYELMWDDLLIASAKTSKPIILSTGMATMPEVVHATSVLRANGCDNLTILHCTSAYPTPFSEANLKAINTLKLAIGCSVGWSDHTVEPGVIHRAVHGWGASVVEFHLDLDGTGEEYGAGHCWLPDEISKVISDVKTGLGADGDGEKRPCHSELADRDWRADPLDGLRPLKKIRVNWKS